MAPRIPARVPRLLPGCGFASALVAAAAHSAPAWLASGSRGAWAGGRRAGEERRELRCDGQAGGAGRAGAAGLWRGVCAREGASDSGARCGGRGELSESALAAAAACAEQWWLHLEVRGGRVGGACVWEKRSDALEPGKGGGGVLVMCSYKAWDMECLRGVCA